NILSYTTTITTSLNQSPAFYGFTTNSPATNSPQAASWDYVDGYSVIVSKAAFGLNGFGGVTIPLVHNSPAKVGSAGLTPPPCDGMVVNTVVATGTFQNFALSSSATAKVNIVSSTQLASLAGFVYADTNNDGVKQASEAGIPGTLITLTGTDINGPVN